MVDPRGAGPSTAGGCPSGDQIYDRIWELRGAREAAASTAEWAELSREIEEETGRIGRLLWQREQQRST